MSENFLTPAQRAKRKYYLANRAACIERTRVWRLSNPEQSADNARRAAQSEKGKQSRAAWQTANPERRREIALKYSRSEKGIQQLQAFQRGYKRPLNVVLSNQLRCRMLDALTCAEAKKAARTFDLIGCTIEFLRNHLEENFQAGMSWANRNLWHIDHKKPCAAFDLTDPEQQKACFHYTNLQPLWAADNIRKGSRYGQNSCTQA